MASPIEDYGLIGDCETAALVGRDGSIDWLCWPRFDSEACFAALLGDRSHGRWLVSPEAAQHSVRRSYRGDTLVLDTTFETADGEVVVTDFMPPRGSTPDVVRMVTGVRGRVPMRTELILRFGYGAVTPWVSRLDDGGLRAIAGPDMVVLRTPVALHGEGKTTVGRFTITEGETVPFVLSHGPSHLAAPAPVNPRAALAGTLEFWKQWARHFGLEGRWSRDVLRSLITLKALTYAPTGGIVAAATTSLPEQLGGHRNWDYRFCWLRDATLTLLSLMNAGYYEEAEAWRDWLLRAVAGNPEQMQIMYGVGGERRLHEWEVPWLPGYEGARPVRIGNAASTQFQLDVYGEVMDALHHGRRGGLTGTESSWSLQRALVQHVESVWQQPDEGIWEMRGPRRHFTHSKVMAWVAVDRAVKAIEDYGLEGPLAHWKQLRSRIHADVCERGFDARRGCFVQAYGDAALDASLLLLPQVGFLPPEDPRIHGTIAAVEAHLLRDGFVLRYDSASVDDGLPAGEGAFLACSFWLADAYQMCDRRDDAEALFERLMALRNDLGLLAEEYDPRARRQVGNFPQAFSHVAMINTALNLGRRRQPAEQRSERAPAP
ncbi:MAG: glycoside hydrolase 15-related protein [Panacagrimonas sp.]|nr:glycoside hydrolase family 15 protein [Panacagrimonas sp.]MCC2655681.1 glycoside hydrolase 15-related protein [Panacagrimonas sp.]